MLVQVYNGLDGFARMGQAREVTMCKTIKQRVKFKAAPAAVYDLLADSRKHTAVTGRKATISRKNGGKFSTRGKKVTGGQVEPYPAPTTRDDLLHPPLPLRLTSSASGEPPPTPPVRTEL